jgi:translation initiation factor 3 subunit C
MIWGEELSASLDQSGAVVVFHRIELSRTQQLAQVLAEKVAGMVDQNEKALDLKFAGTGGWSDRAEVKGEKRGEQVQGERRGRNERVRGNTRGKEAIRFYSATWHSI